MDNKTAMSIVDDPATDTWAQKPHLLLPRAWLSASTVDGMIYAVAGRNGGSRSNVEAYDTGFVPSASQAVQAKRKLKMLWGTVKLVLE